MKVLHVTEELSKKNYSISSLIFFLSNFIINKINYSYNVLTSAIQEDVFKRKDNVNIISFKGISSVFDKNVNLVHLLKLNDVIHVHGIWRTINLLSIFSCLNLKKIFYIHPHGMLLDAALRNKGKINYYLKISFLKFVNFIYGKKLYFISITQLETNSIKKFFPNSNIIFIPNPVPINDTGNEDNKISKRFVFFGRIHPIKNIHLMIEAFKNSNLTSDWKLEIYGINDNQKYFESIKRLASTNPNIIFKDPVFGEEKIKKIKSSWCNLLLSDSEVLSLSVLESAYLQLPSLVNKDIQIDKFADHEGEITNLKVNSIAKKIKEISLWSSEMRNEKGKKLKNFINNFYGIENIYKKYIPLYENFSDTRNCYQKNHFLEYFFKLFFDNNFFQISISYIFNFTIPTLLMLFLTLKGENSLAADLALVSSIFITISQIFSSNMKVQILSNNNINLANQAFQFRFYFSLLLFTIFQYFLYNFNYFEINNKEILSLIVLVILIQWLSEINLVIKEINSKLSHFLLYNSLNLFFCIFYIFIIFFDFEDLKILLLIHASVLVGILVYSNENLKVTFRFNNIIDSIIINTKTLAFLSSLSIIFSSLFWRIIIYSLFSKSIAVIYFACFALGSFPGSIFNIAIGPTYIKQKVSLNKNFKLFLYILFLIVLIFCIVTLFLLLQNLNLNLPNKYFVSFTFSYSVFGAFLMTLAMYKRQYILQKIKNTSENIFLLDIVYGGSISVLCPLLYYFGGPYFVSLTFFLASLMALIMYSSIQYKIKN